MFRDDVLTVKREVYEIIEGGVTNKRIETIAENIPCHLSVNITPSAKSYGVPCVLSDFVLFVSSEIDIKTNDILIVISKKVQRYELFAGDIKIYGLTTQIKCTQEKIIER